MGIGALAPVAVMGAATIGGDVKVCNAPAEKKSVAAGDNGAPPESAFNCGDAVMAAGMATAGAEMGPICIVKLLRSFG